jgi:hypothetical protein
VPVSVCTTRNQKQRVRVSRTHAVASGRVFCSSILLQVPCTSVTLDATFDPIRLWDAVGVSGRDVRSYLLGQIKPALGAASFA